MYAHNLAWKLALVASGRSPDILLDTYGQERGPVAAEVLQLTHALVRFGTLTHPTARWARDTVIPALSRVTAIQAGAVRRMSHHHVAYRSSNLTRPGGGPRLWARARGPGAGHRGDQP
jgi:2-polyprenyl-6-methoxyphenol hydroxylase-like FAD-dependent oxidoreductase